MVSPAATLGCWGGRALRRWSSESGAAYGGLLLTRIELEEGVRVSQGGAAGRLRGLRFRDLETGEVHAAEASLVVNAAGAWVDAVRHRLGIDGARVRPSRGTKRPLLHPFLRGLYLRPVIFFSHFVRRFANSVALRGEVTPGPTEWPGEERLSPRDRPVHRTAARRTGRPVR